MRLLLLFALVVITACTKESPPPYPPPRAVAEAPVCLLPGIDGAPAAAAGPLLRGLAAALSGYGWRIVSSETEPYELVLKGRVVTNPEESKGPYAAVIDWNLSDSQGIGLALFRQRLGGSVAQWEAGDPRSIDALVTDAAQRVIGLPLSKVERAALKGVTGMVDVFVPVTPVTGKIKRVSSIDLLLPRLPLPWRDPLAGKPPPVDPRAAVSPTEPPVIRQAPPTAAGGGPVVAVEDVIGAPGDGDLALAAALRQVLTRNGVPVTRDPARATHRVLGQVEVESGGGANPLVKLHWRVLGPDGRELGSIDQQNRIRAVILYDRWGATATAAATGAADGVVQLLIQSAKAGDQTASPP